MSTIQRDLTYFTVIGTAHDKILLGTEKGTLCVYHMASLQFINEVPYQLSLVQNFQLNNPGKSIRASLKAPFGGDTLEALNRQDD